MEITRAPHTRRRLAVWPIAAALAVCLSVIALPPKSAEAADSGKGILVYIDPGHQRHADNGLEPVGPGASERKPKVSSGTTGAATKKPEYVLNLEVSLLLKQELRQRGYQVGMTRESHDVSVSNRERAEMANRANADLVLRIHADGDDSPKTKGFSVLYPAANVPYTKAIYEDSKAAAEDMLAAMAAGTGAPTKGAIPRSDLTGFNWSKVPNILVEMGFMTNPEEDRRLSEPAYQEKLVQSMADGVDRYFASRRPAPAIEAYDGKLTLLGQTPLYELRGNRFAEAGISLSPQTVTAEAKAGDWYRIATWLGPLWVRADAALPGEPAQEAEQIVLSNETPFYRHPSSTAPIWGSLAPQPIWSFEKWMEWRHIHTWLGDAWIKSAR